jgi:hypothetical protein
VVLCYGYVIEGVAGCWIIYLMCGGSMWWDIIYYIRMSAVTSDTVCDLLYGLHVGYLI